MPEKSKIERAYRSCTFIYRFLWSFDSMFIKDKYYPWYIDTKTLKPVVYPLGFFSIENARAIFKARFGYDSLKLIRFIRGSNLIGRPFSIAKSLPIGINQHRLRIVKRDLIHGHSRKELLDFYKLGCEVYNAYITHKKLFKQKKFEQLLVAKVVREKGQRIYVIKGSHIYRIRSKKKLVKQNVAKYQVERGKQLYEI